MVNFVIFNLNFGLVTYKFCDNRFNMDCEQCNKKRAKSTTDLFIDKSSCGQDISENSEVIPSDYSRRNTYAALPSYASWRKASSAFKKHNVICEHAIMTSAYCTIKHVPLKLVRGQGLSIPCLCVNPTPRQSCSSQVPIQANSLRRESFLYKFDDPRSSLSRVPTNDSSMSRQNSYSSSSAFSPSDESASNGASKVMIDQNEDIIVTPYAQILSNLKKVRSNILELTKNRINSKNKPIEEDNKDPGQGAETVSILDWCLDHLENLETHSSVSNMTMEKFRRMLNIELKQYDEQVSSNHELSDYIISTFLDESLNLEQEQTWYELDDDDEDEEDEEEKIKRRGLNEESSISEMNLKGLKKKLEKDLHNWNFDIFEIQEKSQNNALLLIGFTIFQERGIFSKFQISPKTTMKFLEKIQETYHDMPYHNSTHAADVAQTANLLLNCSVFQKLFTNLEIFAVIFASIIHDVDHPGVTNQYLIATGDKLATLYNDQSVLENHHLSTAFSILKHEEFDILANLNKNERQTFRKLVIDIVIATDMSHHMTLLSDLKTMVETKKVTVSGVLNMDNYSNRKQILQSLVHCADISNPTKELTTYQSWIERIMQEFFRQGDLEKEIGLDISPMCDRETSNVSKTQVGFIDFVVHPLWEAWCDLVNPDCQIALDNMAENRHYFSQKLYDKQVIEEVNEDVDK